MPDDGGRGGPDDGGRGVPDDGGKGVPDDGGRGCGLRRARARRARTRARAPALHLVLLELHVRDAVHEEATRLLVTLIDRHEVTRAIQHVCRGEAGGAGADDRDLLAGARARRLGQHPALGEGLVDDGILDVLDRHGRVDESGHARSLARRRTDAAGELGEVVRRAQVVVGVAPPPLEDHRVELRDDVVDRAACAGVPAGARVRAHAAAVGARQATSARLSRGLQAERARRATFARPIAPRITEDRHATPFAHSRRHGRGDRSGGRARAGASGGRSTAGRHARACARARARRRWRAFTRARNGGRTRARGGGRRRPRARTRVRLAERRAAVHAARGLALELLALERGGGQVDLAPVRQPLGRRSVRLRAALVVEESARLGERRDRPVPPLRLALRAEDAQGSSSGRLRGARMARAPRAAPPHSRQRPRSARRTLARRANRGNRRARAARRAAAAVEPTRERAPPLGTTARASRPCSLLRALRPAPGARGARPCWQGARAMQPAELAFVQRRD